MKKIVHCQQCSKETANLKFCSSSCAATFNNKRRGPRTEITKKKISQSLKQSEKQKKQFTPDRRRQISENSKRVAEKLKSKYDENLLLIPFDQLKFDRLRRRVFLEHNKQCNSCKLDVWLEKEIPYELNHINGNNKDNNRLNLEALCPNCHALTDTWRGRNKNNESKIRNKIDNELLLQRLIEFNWNMRQALLSLNVAAKGGNYSKCHFLKKQYFAMFSE